MTGTKVLANNWRLSVIRVRLAREQTGLLLSDYIQIAVKLL
jgi:hypothetical protein